MDWLDANPGTCEHLAAVAAQLLSSSSAPASWWYEEDEGKETKEDGTVQSVWVSAQQRCVPDSADGVPDTVPLPRLRSTRVFVRVNLAGLDPLKIFTGCGYSLSFAT